MDWPLHILVVDDDAETRDAMRDALHDAGHRVVVASDGAGAAAAIGTTVYDLVITDVRMPKVDGLALLRRARQQSPTTDVILVTGYAAVADAVAALKEGAHDYLTKPFEIDELMVRVERIAERRALRRELDHARQQLQGRSAQTPIIGSSPQMVRLLERIDTIAQSDASVLITGESGTGKELVARTLHERSPRRAKPFVAVNCAAFPEPLIEAELFGHERGAFTGAVKKRDGRFRAADGGTLLLDEIAEVPLPAQAKLLRVLQEGIVEPLGTNESVRVDVRVISATHRNLKERILEGRFREDLYYRLKVLDVDIPPLRARRGDLPLLLQFFLKRYSPPGREPLSISPRAWAVLSQHSFPGNVRELAHAIERAVVLARGGEIDLEHLPADVVGVVTSGAASHPDVRPLAVAIKEFEREYLLRTLMLTSGRRQKAAELLGISRKNLWEKLRTHGIEDQDIEVEE